MKVLMMTMVGLVTLSAGVQAQFAEQILQREALGPDAFLGNAVDLDGDLVVIGCSGVDALAGALQLYEWDASLERWVFGQELKSSGDLPGDRFGSSVAIHQERFVSGAPWAAAGGVGAAGKARVYERSSNPPYDFVSYGTIYASDAEAGAQFGFSIAISEDWVMVGAPDKDWSPSVDASGQVYCYERKSGALHWGPVQDLFIRPSSGHSGERFGYALDMQGTRAIIGVPLGGSSASGTGRASLQSRSGGVWTEEDSLSPSEEAGGFGRSVAIDGSLAVVGALYDDSDDGLHLNSGSAFVFERSGSTWSQVAKLTASDEDGNVFFGAAVAIERNRILVGTYDEACYVFSRRDLGSGEEWFQSAKLEASDGVNGDQYGRGVAIDDDRMVIGASRADPDSSSVDGGKAYLYRYHRGFASYCFAEESDCPCGNDDPLAGCENSAGQGALIAALGSPSVSDMNFMVRVTGLPANVPAFAFAGVNALRAPFVDGLRCAGGALVRLPVKFASAAGELQYGASSTITKVGVSAGDIRYYQCWYRDPSGSCGTGSNLSNGLRVRFGS